MAAIEPDSDTLRSDLDHFERAIGNLGQPKKQGNIQTEANQPGHDQSGPRHSAIPDAPIGPAKIPIFVAK